MDLRETATIGWESWQRVTSKYVYSVTGLKAHPELLSLSNSTSVSKDETPAPVSAYVSLIRAGEGRLRAARLLGIEPSEMRKQLRIDIVLRDAVELAEEELAEEIEALFLDKVRRGDAKDVLTWLKKRRKDRWGDDAAQINVQTQVFGEISTGNLISDILAIQNQLRKPLVIETTGEEIGK